MKKFHRLWVSKRQTKERRMEKYKIIKEMGLCADWARRIRDWTEPHFKQFVGANNR